MVELNDRTGRLPYLNGRKAPGFIRGEYVKKRPLEIADTSSVLVKGRDWPEFHAAMGGVEKMNQEHTAAVRELESWYRDGDDRD